MRETKALVCLRSSRTAHDRKFPKSLPLASVLAYGITPLCLTGSDNPHPWLHIQQVPCCQLKTFGGNSHRHPDTRILGQIQPRWPLYARRWPFLEPRPFPRANGPPSLSLTNALFAHSVIPRRGPNTHQFMVCPYCLSMGICFMFGNLTTRLLS